MNAMTSRSLGLAAAALLWVSSVSAQQRRLELDLSRLAQGQDLQVFHRSATPLTDSSRNGLRLSENAGDGIAYINGAEFTNGTIECDIRGKDVQGNSFVGIAFHGADSATYEAVYFRPFNFQTTDSARHAHAVQYISHPTDTWQKLRAEHPGVYEKAVNPVPDPNSWFHARIVVAGSKVSVFVGDAKEPSLVVTRLSDRTSGLVGLWVGNTSGGDFANLRITP